MTAEHHSLLALAEHSEHLAEVRTMASDVLGREWSPLRSCELLDADSPAWSADLWVKVRELGWTDILLSGGTVADLCVVAEEIGASTASLPLVSAAVANWCAGRRAEGNVGTVVASKSVGANRSADTTSQISGRDPFVPFGDIADSFLVHALDESGAGELLILPAEAAGLSRTALRPLDAMPSATVEWRSVAVDGLEILASGAEASRRWEETILRLTLGWTAELTGAAAAANALAVGYARSRYAFGRPIGAFQAIKHRLVDQRAAIEVSRALVARAGLALESGAPDSAALTSLAAFWATESLRSVPEGVIQVLGGVGYTWENVAHVYLRRAAVLTTLLRELGDHRDIAADWLRAR